MVSWAREGGGAGKMKEGLAGFFPLFEFFALSPEQNGAKFGKRKKPGESFLQERSQRALHLEPQVLREYLFLLFPPLSQAAPGGAGDAP